MKFLLLLGLTVVLAATFIMSNTSTVSAAISNHCTSSNPCTYQVCGDHICAPGEFDQLKAQIVQAQRGSTTSNVTSGNMTITSQSTGTVVASMMSYIDRASDGTIVLIRSDHPLSGQPLALGIGFFTSSENAIANQNYAITITQDGKTVFSNPNGHTNTGIDTMTTFPLPSSNPISIEVTLNGIGPTTADPSTWNGVKGEVLDFLQGPENTPTAAPVQTTTSTPIGTTVPEFGPVASIVLAIAVLSVMVFVAKTRINPRL